MNLILQTILVGSFSWPTLATSCPNYPAHWWKPVNKTTAPSWEILPQEAKQGEVILSKRNELGILSNFAPTKIVFRGKEFASLEGLWQMMKFPEGPDDLRAKHSHLQWPWTRKQVAQMTGFEAKRAGNIGSKNMQKMGINWVTFRGKRITYRTAEKAEHYRLIREAMQEKLKQNPEVTKILLQTGDLVLRPDHKQSPNAPPAWKYYEIWTEIRTELQRIDQIE